MPLIKEAVKLENRASHLQIMENDTNNNLLHLRNENANNINHSEHLDSTCEVFVSRSDKMRFHCTILGPFDHLEMMK